MFSVCTSQHMIITHKCGDSCYLGVFHGRPGCLQLTSMILALNPDILEVFLGLRFLICHLLFSKLRDGTTGPEPTTQDGMGRSASGGLPRKHLPSIALFETSVLPVTPARTSRTSSGAQTSPARQGG